MLAPRDLQRDTLQVEIEVRWARGSGSTPPQIAQDENRRLKRLLAESMLDNAVLKDLLGKNV
jgi:hypothetical protein